MKIAGAVLVLLGFAGLVWGGVPYRQTRNVAQIGDLKMQVTEKKQLALPPLVSGFAILVGTVLWCSARPRPMA
ncbi:MAG TPA: DUF3185 domain-containing protein [Candidatus Eisenbacteria bacterium]|jgi:hypothetical protein